MFPWIHLIEVISSALKSFDVIHALRITKKVGGADKQTLSIKLVFSCSSLPSFVYLGYSRHPVKEYVPPVVQCYKCRLFGHFSSQCRGKQRCARCGADHMTSSCSIHRPLFKCVNCGQNHSAAYGGCSAYKEANEVKVIATKQKISFSAARQLISTQKSFASIVSGSVTSPPPRAVETGGASLPLPIPVSLPPDPGQPVCVVYLHKQILCLTRFPRKVWRR